MPTHCNITRNEKADSLAKKGSKLTQINMGISYKETDTDNK
jgi:hypothetical protein